MKGACEEGARSTLWLLCETSDGLLMNLKRNYCGLIVALQWVYSGSTVALQWLYSGSTMMINQIIIED